MRFRQHQEQARTATRALVALFALTVLFTVVAVNLALAFTWRLQFGGHVVYPNWFFETNTAVTLGFVLGGAWLESLQLRDGGAHVARMVGGREIVTPADAAERRLRNIVDEMAIASGLKSPRLFVLDREQAINALAAGWEQQDSVVAVTRGALERLTRDELQGVVAHEFAHILNGDTRLNMRLIGMVFGLQMIFNFGRTLMSAINKHGRRGPTVLIGLALVAVGSVGWLAGRLLKAGVSRQREHLADASAVQFTRQPTGLGNALRKVAGQLGRGQRIAHANAEVISHLLLSSDALLRAGWLATHPPIEERLQRIFGHPVPPLADDPVPLAEPPARELPVLDFVPPVGRATGDGVAEAGAGAAIAQSQRPSVPTASSLLLSPGIAAPQSVRAALLACLVPGPDATAELQAWTRAMGASGSAQLLLQAVLALPARQRQPWFERLLGYAAALGLEQRRTLLRDAVAMLQADGRVSLHEYLLARVMQRQLAPRHHAASERRHLTIAELAEPVAIVTSALASLLPAPDGRAWSNAVLAGLALPANAAGTPRLGRQQLDAAIERLALLGRMHRPALVKQWMAAPGAAAMPRPMADALRCVCLLIDTPLPPRLAALFEAPPPHGEVASPLDLAGAIP